jgi:hypothetical protein
VWPAWRKMPTPKEITGVLHFVQDDGRGGRRWALGGFLRA